MSFFGGGAGASIPRLLVLMIKDYPTSKGQMSPAFICLVLLVEFFEAYVYETWRGLEAIISHILVNLGSNLFTVRGLLSLIICFSTVADIHIFMWRLRRALRMELYSQLYWQSCLRFLVFVCLIVIGGANMIEKAWHGALVIHQHVLIPLTFCAFGFIRLWEKY